jgi:hypothetical protein
MIPRLFRAGDKVRVLASPHDDWAGTATVTANQASNNPLVSFAKDNPTPCTYRTGFWGVERAHRLEGPHLAAVPVGYPAQHRARPEGLRHDRPRHLLEEALDKENGP